jgi:hypothetical protein
MQAPCTEYAASCATVNQRCRKHEQRGQNEERHHGSVPARRTARKISEDNPAGTDGFEFVEFAHPDPKELEALFARMGYEPVARHKTKAITVWRQGDINYISMPRKAGSHAMRFVGSTVPAHRPWPGAWSTPGRHFRACRLEGRDTL